MTTQTQPTLTMTTEDYYKRQIAQCEQYEDYKQAEVYRAQMAEFHRMRDVGRRLLWGMVDRR